jgi:hypothetical protein
MHSYIYYYYYNPKFKKKNNGYDYIWYMLVWLDPPLIGSLSQVVDAHCVQ